MILSAKNVGMPHRTPYSLRAHANVSSIYLDESGSRNSRGGFVVVGFIKVRKPSVLARTVRDVRQKHRFYGEIKFLKISKKNLPFYFDLVEKIAMANVRVGGSVYDSATSFTPEEETWEQQARMAALLIRGNTNRGELVNVFSDLVQTPRGESAAEVVKKSVNSDMGSHSVFEAYDVDSQSTDLIQLADIIASSIAFERRQEK